MKNHTEPKLIKRKIKKNIIREVYLYDDMIVKRFIKMAVLPDIRKIWEMEHRALQRLDGLPTPKTFGYVEKKINGAREIIYAREFIDGVPLEKFHPEDVQALASAIALIHRRGVIIRDPRLENFVRTSDKKIIFFDFGRALVFHPKNPLLAYFIGKELARILFHAGLYDAGLQNRFLDSYFQFFQPTRITRRLMMMTCIIWNRHFQASRTRKKIRKPPKNILEKHSC
jgi:serine/threonine protein kinase